MITLKNLEGSLHKEQNALLIFKASDIGCIIGNSMAATTAGINGAINVWEDSDGNIRCEAMRFCRSLEKKKFNDIKKAVKWTKKWLSKIN